MTNLKEYIRSIGDSYGIEDTDFFLNVSRILVNNKWFGCKVVNKDGQLFIPDDELIKIEKKISSYCELYYATEEEKASYLIDGLTDIMPKTAQMLLKFSKTYKLDDRSKHYLADFLLTYLGGELQEASDAEVGYLMDDAFEALSKAYADLLVDFVNWLKRKVKTVYKMIYSMNKYADRTEESSAYDTDYYLTILYHLYNSGYIESNDMYASAAESKNYTDTWLFLSLHFLCSLRNTDFAQLSHPRLTSDPQTILDQIKMGIFPEESARAIIYSITMPVDIFFLQPNKTKDKSGVGTIKFFVPESVEIHIGTLFAAAEAHFQLAHEDKKKPLIRRISTYEEIQRYMGDEIGDLFLEANFRSRSANKSYLQTIEALTDEILGENDEFKVKGYMLAALARSHKGSYADFAKTTSIYLKDAKMSGYTPEFVAKELFERGVLSMSVSMLLKMLLGEDYKKLSVVGQTRLLKELDISPEEAEKSVAVLQKSMKQAMKLVSSIYNSCSQEELVKVLHRIGNGEASSKCGTCMCFLTAMGKPCPQLDNNNCPGCEYEISTKTTMFLMVREVKRLQDIYKNTDNEKERQRSKAIVKDVVIPSLDAMLHAMEEIYGVESRKMLERIIEEI